jgi:hypothetical protein
MSISPTDAAMPSLSAEGANIKPGEHPGFERRWRRPQAVLFATFVLLVVCALAGVFGSGPSAAVKVRVAGGGGATLTYQRFARARAPEILIVHIDQRPNGSTLDLMLDSDLGKWLNLQTFSPQPVQSAVGNAGTAYRFTLDPGASGDIRIEAKPQLPGLARGIISIDGRPIQISQIVWP